MRLAIRHVQLPGTMFLLANILQRNYKDSELRETERFKEGKQNSHLANDSSQYLLLPRCELLPTDIILQRMSDR